MGCSQSVVALRNVQETVPTAAQQVDSARSLIFSSAFFSGANHHDLENLARLAVPENAERSHRKVLFASTDSTLLLGGATLNWGYVSNQHGMTTTRNDVLGEACLLRSNAARLSNLPVGSVVSVADDLNAVEQIPRKEVEYLSAERGHLPNGQIRQWYVLDAADIYRLADSSKTFETFLRERLQLRAGARLCRPGILTFLSESENNFACQAFDYVKLSSLAARYSSDPSFFVICDGKLIAHLEDVGTEPAALSRENSNYRITNKARKSADLSISSPVPHRRSDSELSSAAKSDASSTSPAGKFKRTLTHHLAPGATYGENSVVLDVTKTSVTFQVAEEGVALVLKQQYWESFISSVASEKTQKMILEEADFRTSMARVRTFFPCFRKCKSSMLRLLMDSVELDAIDPDATHLPDSWVCFVRRGTIKCFDPATDRDTLFRQGQAFGFESALKINRGSRHSGSAELSSSSNTAASSSVPMSMNDSAAGDVRHLHSSSSQTLLSHMKILSAVGSARGSLGGAPLESISAAMWRMPERVLIQAFEADPVFAADFEFQVRRPNESFFNTPRRSTGSPFGGNTVKHCPVSFQAVLNHPLAASHFTKFLKSIHAQENLDFYLAVKYFPRTPEDVARELTTKWLDDLDKDVVDEPPQLTSEQSRSRIVAILREFIAETSLTPINVNSEINRTLTSALMDESVDDPSCFAQALDEVYSILLTDSFPRFASNSDIVHDMIAEVMDDGDGSLSTKSTSRSLSQSPLRMLPRPSPNFSAGRKSLFSSQRSLNKELSLGDAPT